MRRPCFLGSPTTRNALLTCLLTLSVCVVPQAERKQPWGRGDVTDSKTETGLEVVVVTLGPETHCVDRADGQLLISPNAEHLLRPIPAARPTKPHHAHQHLKPQKAPERPETLQLSGDLLHDPHLSALAFLRHTTSPTHLSLHPSRPPPPPARLPCIRCLESCSLSQQPRSARLLSPALETAYQGPHVISLQDVGDRDY
ncbi:unnamed protein product [Pleuronectes platessa]|uniref:Uncharacterized protein n=1 Tax=Pleuronectes platessa TaxID=8262 RepID=A0A9N7YYB1_PLEPL|nr:unnamed protein product [Pleuronectes platessa]